MQFIYYKFILFKQSYDNNNDIIYSYLIFFLSRILFIKLLFTKVDCYMYRIMLDAGLSCVNLGSDNAVLSFLDATS